MSDLHLDEAWPLVRAAFRTHDTDISEDTAKAISEQVARDLITRGHVLTWRQHAAAVEAHTDTVLRELRAEVEVLRRRVDRSRPDPHPITEASGIHHLTIYPPGWQA